MDESYMALLKSIYEAIEEHREKVSSAEVVFALEYYKYKEIKQVDDLVMGTMDSFDEGPGGN